MVIVIVIVVVVVVVNKKKKRKNLYIKEQVPLLKRDKLNLFMNLE